MQPGFGFGPQVGVQLELAQVGSLALVGRIGFETEQRVEDTGTLAYRPLQGGLVFCAWPWGEGTTQIGLCGAAAVGSMRVAASGFKAYSGTVYEVWVEAVPQVVGRTMLGEPLFVQLAFGAPLRIVVPDFRYTDSAGRTQSAFSMSRVGFMLEASAGVRF
ncbi:MAG TPA: hypothetical protein VJV78_48805 [Polyangiales bacterium]|nr:hypothetical protein [Polyangiales bacterium]